MEEAQHEEAATGDSGEAPQPSTDTGRIDASARVHFFYGFGFIFQEIFRVSILGYYFWTAVLNFVAGTALIAAFQVTTPTIGGVPACPAKQSIYFIVAAWYAQAATLFGVTYGCAQAEQLGPDAYRLVSPGVGRIGFLTKVVPTWGRLLHVFNLCQLNTVVLMVSLLPECNANGLLATVGARYIAVVIMMMNGETKQHIWQLFCSSCVGDVQRRRSDSGGPSH